MLTIALFGLCIYGVTKAAKAITRNPEKSLEAANWIKNMFKRS